MARTAVVNPRKRRARRRRSNPQRSRRRRRRNYGAAAVVNPRRRRRRRRNYGSMARRRNPASPYATSGYFRRPNPSMFDIDDLTDTVPAATGGVLAARWAVKQAGAWEPAKDGTLEPGLKHAIAVLVAATVGGQLVGQLLGSESKGNIARIAALGYGGDLFVRARFGRDSAFIQDNFSLSGDDDCETQSAFSGFQSQSALGETYVDATGMTWKSTPEGWQPMAGLGADLIQDEDGNMYLVESNGAVNGFQSQSALGMRPASAGESSFGYASRG